MTGVVLAPAIRVDQRLVSFGNLAKLRRRHPVTRIDVRMEPARQALVGALDVADVGRPFDAQDDVKIHYRGSGLAARGSCLMARGSNITQLLITRLPDYSITQLRFPLVDHFRIDHVAVGLP